MNNQADKNQGNRTGADQGRSAYSTGTTTQGGSNHGQGSMQLGGAAYEQGRETGAGSNYENEAGRIGELSETSSSTQKGGGAGGYDVSREQEQVNKEREDMNSERDLDDVDVERPQTSPEEGEQANPGETPRPQ